MAGMEVHYFCKLKDQMVALFRFSNNSFILVLPRQCQLCICILTSPGTIPCMGHPEELGLSGSRQHPHKMRYTKPQLHQDCVHLNIWPWHLTSGVCSRRHLGSFVSEMSLEQCCLDCWEGQNQVEHFCDLNEKVLCQTWLFIR